MSENLWPCKPPGEAAAELFHSCLWEMKEPTDAADKAAYYLFRELIQRLGEDHPRARELIKQIAANPDAPGAGELQTELQLGINRLGLRRAKRIFKRFGEPLTQTRLNEIEDCSLI